jgi:nucleoside-diphosphate-sugar epimerase
MDLLSNEGFDMLCHNAARVTDYRSLDFDIVQALAENTNNIRKIIEAMLRKGLRAIVFTGSVLEANEGAGSYPMRAFSPYGLSREPHFRGGPSLVRPLSRTLR